MSRPRKTRLHLMTLENRENPSTMFYNSVTDKFTGNSGDVNLSISFIANNSIVWSTSPATTPAVFAAGADLIASNLTISLTGTGVSSTGTSVGNTVDINLGGHSLSGNLNITMSNSSDKVHVFNGTVLGNVSITTNADDDQVLLGGGNVPLVIGKNLKVNEAGGDDSIGIAGPFGIGVGGNATIQMGAGANAYALANPIKIGGDLMMQAGNGSDPINQVGVAGSSIGGKATFLPGPGQNSLLLPAGLTIVGNVAYAGGAGTDNVLVDASLLANLNVSLGAGIDNFTYGPSASVGGSATLKGGPPISGTTGDVYTTFVFVSWPNSVTGFFP